MNMMEPAWHSPTDKLHVLLWPEYPHIRRREAGYVTQLPDNSWSAIMYEPNPGSNRVHTMKHHTLDEAKAWLIASKRLMG